MARQPILTRKSYREQLEKQQHELESGEHPSPIEMAPRKKSLREKYNRFLNGWLIAMGILLIVILGIQIFL